MIGHRNFNCFVMIFSNELEPTGIYVTVAIFYNSTILIYVVLYAMYQLYCIYNVTQCIMSSYISHIYLY